MKKIATVGACVGILLMAVFCFTHNTPVASASAGGLDWATLTGPNEIRVEYEYVLDHNDMDSYSNLGLGLTGRNITGGVPTLDGKGIILTFDGMPVPPDTIGSIDIASTVTWQGGGNFGGEENWPVDDWQHPELGMVTMKYDVDHSSSLTAGDVLQFSFSEPINKATLTAGNLDARLVVSNGHSFGSTGAGMDIQWNQLGTTLTVYLGSDATVTNGDAVEQGYSITDIAGNLLAVPGPISLPTSKPIARTLYFNGAIDQDWGTLGNWWDDSGFADPADSLPTPYDNVVISETIFGNSGGTVYINNMLVVGNGVIGMEDLVGILLSVNVSGTATFTNAAVFAGALVGDAVFETNSILGAPFGGPGFAISSAYITGNVTFSAPTTANYGTIRGGVIFHGEYGNAGLVIGDVEFNDITSNPGTIVGHATFRDNSQNGTFGSGTIQGDVDVYYPSNNPLDSAENVTGTITYHGYTTPAFAGGDGDTHPYEIETCLQLQDVGNFLSANFVLNNNIDCSDTVNWPGGEGFAPIGDNTYPFTGYLDGNGYVIDGLYINRPSTDYVGLFGKKGSDGDVENLGLTNVNITGDTPTGGLAGFNLGTIKNSYVTGSVTGGDIVGGLVGQNSGDGDIQESYMRGSVVGGGLASLGGLVGKMGGIIRHGYAAATLGGVIDGTIGGLVGESGSVVKDSFWDKDIAGNFGAQGTGKTTAEMKDILTFTTGYEESSWDFLNTWNIDPEVNNGYPYLTVFDHPTVAVLTEIKPVPAKVKGTSVTYEFSVDVQGQAEYLSEMCGGDSEVLFTSISDNPGAQQMIIRHLKPGITYQCSFYVQTAAGDSEPLTVGPFTVVKSSVGGYLSSGYLANHGIKLESKVSKKPKSVSVSTTPTVQVTTPSLEDKEACPVDQQMTQNLKAPSRNGTYNSYTGGIVKDAKILQAHLARLGFNPGPLDGILGPLSDGGIKRLQTFLGTKADGYVGPLTRALLNKSCE